MKGKLLLMGMIGGGWWLFRRVTETPQTHLKDKVVIITGAASGIGRAATKTFAAQGAKIVLVDRQPNRLQQAEAELARYPVDTLTIKADVTDLEDLHTIVEETLNRFGRIDVLVNNAGVGDGGQLQSIPVEQMKRTVDVNLFAVMNLTRLVLPTMLEQRSGHIVNISSVFALLRGPGQNVYAATKAGVAGFTDSLRRELHGTGIGVSAIMPGATATPILGGTTREEVREVMDTAGFNIPGVSLDDPAVVGGAIVNAVRYHQRRRVLGGPTMVALCWLGEHFPGVMDRAYKQISSEDMFSTTDRVMDRYKDLYEV